MPNQAKPISNHATIPQCPPGAEYNLGMNHCETPVLDPSTDIDSFTIFESPFSEGIGRREELQLKSNQNTLTPEERIEFGAYSFFPHMGQERARELFIKRDTTGLEASEVKELDAWFVFPQNPRGRELLMKRSAGTVLSQEENNELDQLLFVQYQNSPIYGPANRFR